MSALPLTIIAACQWLWEVQQQHLPVPGQPQAHAHVPMSVPAVPTRRLRCSCPPGACRQCPSTAPGSCTRLQWVPGCACHAAAPSQRTHLAGGPSADPAPAGEVLAGARAAARSTHCMVQAAPSQPGCIIALSLAVHRCHTQGGMHRVWTHLTLLPLCILCGPLKLGLR